MKVTHIAAKGIFSAVALYIAYVNQNLSPLFWVLIGLALVDVILNAHKEGKQLEKVGSMFMATAGTIGVNYQTIISNPEAKKIIVAVLTLVYIQIVVPQVITLIEKFGKKSGRLVKAADTAIVDETKAITQAATKQAETGQTQNFVTHADLEQMKQDILTALAKGQNQNA